MTKAYASIVDPRHASKNGTRPPLPIVRPADLAGKVIPERRWCVPGWFPDKAVSLLTGDGGTGKSLLGMQLATCSALGLPFLGIELAPRNVLIVACEDDIDEMHRRQESINVSLGIDFADLGTRLSWLSMVASDALLVSSDRAGRVITTPTYDNLRQHCRERNVQLVIIDTAADTFGGLEIDRQQVTRYVRYLETIARECDGAVILLSHPSVAGLRDKTGISGNTAWRNAVRSVVTLLRPDDDDTCRFAGDPGNIRYLERLKGNYSAIGGRLTISWQRGAFLLEGAGDTVGAVDQLSLEVTIERALKDMLSRNLSPSPASQAGDRYVARMLKAHHACRDYDVRHIEGAVNRMLVNGDLRVVKTGSGKNARQTVVPKGHPRLPGEPENADDGRLFDADE